MVYETIVALEPTTKGVEEGIDGEILLDKKFVAKSEDDARTAAAMEVGKYPYNKHSLSLHIYVRPFSSR